MDQLESLLGSIDPADREMAKLLISEIGKGSDHNESGNSGPYPGYYPAAPSSVYTTEAAAVLPTPNIGEAYQTTDQTSDQTQKIPSSFSATVPAPSHPYARDTYPDGWRWASDDCEDGTKSERWCTFKPTRGLQDVITVLAHFDHQTGISIMLALPEVYEGSYYWADASNRAAVMQTVKKIMDTVQLSACLKFWSPSAQTREKVGAGVDEFLMKTANSLMKELDLSVEGNCTFAFREAKKWDDIIPGLHYADPKTLIEDRASRDYTTTTLQTNRYLALTNSLREARVKDPGGIERRFGMY